jgi:hypothetical protein
MSVSKNRLQKAYNKYIDLFKTYNFVILTLFYEFEKLRTNHNVIEIPVTVKCLMCNKIDNMIIKSFIRNPACRFCSFDKELQNSYKKYTKLFRDNSCHIKTSFSEFRNLRDTVSQTSFISINYIASCGHENTIRLDSFTRNNSGLICKTCMNIKQKTKNTDGSSKQVSIEDNGIVYLTDILSNDFCIKLTDEGCLADFCIKPNIENDNKYLPVQLKTCETNTNAGYKFEVTRRYPNHLIFCLCIKGKKIWLLDGNKIKTNSGIGIGLNKSKYDINEIKNQDDLIYKITEFYNQFPKMTFDEINIPITKKYQKEQEYRKHRENICNFINFEYPIRKQLVYDFMINGKKIQEKTGYFSKNAIQFKTSKTNSLYKIEEIDFFWLNCPDKEHFYIIPAEYLIDNVMFYVNLNNLDAWYNIFCYKYSQVDENSFLKIFDP